MPPTQPSARRQRLLLAAALAGAVLVVLAIALQRRPAAASSPAAAPPARPTQLALVHAEPFRLDRGFAHRWRADQPVYDRGWLLVLAGAPELLRPRQQKEPVLYVGAQTAERVNTGQDSGRLVVLVPGDFRLEDAPIFLGGVALPEELRQPQIDAELAAARAGGAVPPAAGEIEKALAPLRTFADDYDLHLRAIDLVEVHSPGERDLIAGWRVPRIR